VRGPHTTARGFAAEAAPRLPENAAEALRRLTEAYLAERFGGRRPRGTRGGLRSLRRSLRRDPLRGSA
jgi:hypothetical protein